MTDLNAAKRRDRSGAGAGWFATAGLILFECVCSTAWADGGYFAEHVVPARPVIPAQRAMIVHRNGVETLIVESAFKSEGSSVGWVLPLPAEPTKLAVADPGVLSTMSILSGPTITHDLEAELGFLVGVLIVCIVAGLLAAATGKPIQSFLATFFVFLVLASILLPALSSARSQGRSLAVEVKSTQRVGDFDINVLRATDASTLGGWLANNGFQPLDERAEAVVDDYIARHWCFLVAKLANSSPGQQLTPHPIQVDFPASQPVYPMMLTGLADSKMDLELYVVADRQASVEGMHTALATRLATDSHSTNSQPDKADTFILPSSPVFRSNVFDIRVGQPEVMAMLWPDCVLTKLTGKLLPAEMDRDLVLSLGELKPHRDHVYSERGRRGVVCLVLLSGGCLLTAVIPWALRRKRWPIRRRLLVVGVSALVVAAAGLSAYVLARPVIPARPLNRGHRFWSEQYLAGLTSVLIEKGSLHSVTSDREIATLGKKLVEAGICEPDNELLTNPFTGEPIRMERSPGNFSIRREGKKAWICFYDEVGRESRVKLPP